MPYAPGRVEHSGTGPRYLCRLHNFSQGMIPRASDEGMSRYDACPSLFAVSPGRVEHSGTGPRYFCRLRKISQGMIPRASDRGMSRYDDRPSLFAVSPGRVEQSGTGPRCLCRLRKISQGMIPRASDEGMSRYDDRPSLFAIRPETCGATREDKYGGGMREGAGGAPGSSRPYTVGGGWSVRVWRGRAVAEAARPVGVRF